MLRSEHPAAWASASAQPDWAERLGEVEFAQRITAAMDARGVFLGPALATALADIPARSVLDVGGGSGAYACALVDHRPEVRATVLERPPVDSAARTLLAERGYLDRIEVSSGDMFTDPLPGGHDLHLFSHVLHDWVLLMHSTPGKCWSDLEHTGMLDDAGFAYIGSRPTAADRTAIVARKPA